MMLAESEVPMDEESVMAAEDYGEEKKEEEDFFAFCNSIR
jgi:hypothetical protein